jgi:hypothetical protein
MRRTEEQNVDTAKAVKSAEVISDTECHFTDVVNHYCAVLLYQ